MVDQQRLVELMKHRKEGDVVDVYAWIKSKRESKEFAFIVVNDGSMQNDLQLILGKDTTGFQLLPSCTTGAAIKAQGRLKKSPGKGQEWEVELTALEVIGEADPRVYPLQKKGHSLEFLRDNNHLRGRTNTFGAVFRIRNALAMLIHEFFQARGFIWAHTPIITANDCEGAGALFQVTTLNLEEPPRNDQGKIDYLQDFFGRQAHLTVSGQLNGEAMAQSFGRIYTFGPTFRAENSNTVRHLSEFWMVEPEMAFTDLRGNMQTAEDFLKFLFSEIAKRCPDELSFLEKHYGESSGATLEKLGKQPFHRITYTDAIKELINSKHKFDYDPKWGCDLQTEHEKFLTDQIFSGPVIVFDYPKEIKAFYMRVNEDQKTVAAMDVLVPRIGEIIGGSQREERIDILLQKMKEFNIKTSGLEWYLDLRRFGSTPHAGFGLGFERLVQYVTGMSNIRDVIPFARAPQNVSF